MLEVDTDNGIVTLTRHALQRFTLRFPHRTLGDLVHAVKNARPPNKKTINGLKHAQCGPVPPTDRLLHFKDLVFFMNKQKSVVITIIAASNHVERIYHDSDKKQRRAAVT